MRGAEADDERFITLTRGWAYRMGAGHRQGEGFLELTVLLFPGGAVDVGHLRRCADCLSILDSNGFVLAYGGNGSVTCEISSPDEGAERAARSAVLQLEGITVG